MQRRRTSGAGGDRFVPDGCVARPASSFSLGQNVAGKAVAIKMLITLLIPTRDVGDPVVELLADAVGDGSSNRLT
jgi:hypothetical protein